MLKFPVQSSLWLSPKESFSAARSTMVSPPATGNTTFCALASAICASSASRDKKPSGVVAADAFSVSALLVRSRLSSWNPPASLVAPVAVSLVLAPKKSRNCGAISREIGPSRLAVKPSPSRLPAQHASCR